MQSERRQELMAARGDRRREEVAAAIGISVSALCAYENGTRNPSDTIKRKLAHFYGVTVGELFFGEKHCPRSDAEATGSLDPDRLGRGSR